MIMTLQYKNRWRYAILLQLALLIGGAYFVVKPGYVRLKALHVALAEIQHSLRQYKLNLSPINTSTQLTMRVTHKTNVEIIAELLNLANVNGLSLESMQRLVRVDEFNLHMKFHFIGGYAQWLVFMQGLAEREYFIVIKDFNFTAIDEAELSTHLPNQYQWVLELLIININWAQDKIRIQQPMKITNPFCVTPHFYPLLDNPPSNTTPKIILPQYSIKQLKMVGSFSHKKNFFALIALPNHQLQIVSIHQRIGQEGGQIKTINAHHMQIKLPNGSLTEIVMQ